MRRLIGRILAWFLSAYVADEYVQIQKASWDDATGCWNAQVRVFTKNGTLLGTVQSPDLNKTRIREAVAGKN